MIEENYTKYPNPILEALTLRAVPGGCRKLIDFIIRNSAGYHRQAVETTYKRISRETNLRAPHIARALNQLRAANMITISYPGTHRRLILGMVQDPEEWGELSPREGNKAVTQTGKVTHAGNKPLPERVTNATHAGKAPINKVLKENQEKKNLKKNGLSAISNDISFDSWKNEKHGDL